MCYHGDYTHNRQLCHDEWKKNHPQGSDHEFDEHWTRLAHSEKLVSDIGLLSCYLISLTRLIRSAVRCPNQTCPRWKSRATFNVKLRFWKAGYRKERMAHMYDSSGSSRWICIELYQYKCFPPLAKTPNVRKTNIILYFWCAHLDCIMGRAFPSLQNTPNPKRKPIHILP